MAFTKNYLNEMFGTVLVLSALLSTVSAVDCHGKSFHCVNSTHFMICVDLGGGVSQAIDNFLVACPPPTVCQGTNHFECEFPVSTTLHNDFSETTHSWEEVATVASTGNITKEFSENYMNTERITTTAEYSITTDTIVDVTTATTAELYVDNKLNIPEILPTLAADIATSAVETTQTLNENLNITEFVSTDVTVDITTAVVETVTRTIVESKNLSEPVIVDEITKPAEEVTTENIIITDTVATDTEYKPKPRPSATEQVPQTIHENLNITAPEASVVAIDIFTNIIETVTQNMAEGANLTNTDHVVVDEFTVTTTETTTDNIIITDPLGIELGYIESSPTEPAEEITTENIIITDTVATDTEYKPSPRPSATKQVPQTIYENLNITAPEASVVAMDITTNIIETVTQNMAEGANLTNTDHVVVDEFTVTTTQKTSDNIIITDPLGIELGYIESSPTEPAKENTTENIIITDTVATDTGYKPRPRPSATEQVSQTIHENLNITAPEASVVTETVTQNMAEGANLTNTDHVVVDEFTVTTTKTTTDNIIITDPLGIEVGYMESSPTEPTTQNANDNFLVLDIVQSKMKPPEVNILLENESVIPNILSTETPKAQHINPQNTEKPISGTANNITATNLHKVSILKTNNESKSDSFVQNILPVQSTATLETILETATRSIDHLTTIPVLITVPTTLPIIVTTDVSYGHEAKENNLYKNKYTAVNNVATEKTLTNTQNPAATVPDGTWTEIIDYGASTEQPTTVNEGSLTTDTTQNVVTEYIIVPTRPAVNLEIATTDFVSTIVRDIVQSKPPDFEAKMNNDTQVPITENIISPVYNRASTNGLMTVESVYMDTITTEAVDIPTTTSSAQPVTPFEDNMKIETTLSVTENIVSTVYNEGGSNNFMTAQAINMDTITTEALDIPTTISNAHLTQPTIEDNMKIGISLPVTEEILSTVNNGLSTNDLMTSQSVVNVVTTTTEAVGTPTASSNTQSTLPAVEDSIKTDAPFGNTVTNDQTLSLIDIMKTEDQLTATAATENIVSSIKNGDNINGFMTSQSIKVDDVNTEVMHGTYTTISHVQTMRPTFEDDITTDTILTATRNTISSVNYEVSTNDFTTAQSINIDGVNTEATHVPTTISNAPPKTPTTENTMALDVPLPATENILSSENNGASTNGLLTLPGVNRDIIKTQATINNIPAMKTALEDSMRTAPPLSATKNIVREINNGVSTKGLTTRKAGLESVVQLTTETYTVPSSTVIVLSLNNEKTVETVHGGIITSESGTSFPDIIKESPNNDIQNIQTLINSSANTAVESDVKLNYKDNKMTIIKNLREGLPEFSSPSKNIPDTDLSVDKSTSRVSQIGNVNEQASVTNAATSQNATTHINDNITRATTVKSIITFGSDSAFDISNQNLMNPQVQSKTIQVNNNLQLNTTERNDQADNIIRNPLENQLFNSNKNSESIGTSVTNTNAEGIGREISQQVSSGITGSPINAHIDHEKSIDFIISQSSIGVTASIDILTTNGYSANIPNVNSAHETDYQLNSRSEIPVTISFNQKIDKLATAGVDVSTVSNTLPAKTSIADTIILDSLNPHEPMDNSFRTPSGTSVVDTYYTTRKSGSNQDPSIISTSNTSDGISEVKSPVIIGGNIDSPTVLHNNEIKLPTSSHGFAEATGGGTTMKGNKGNEDRRDDTLSKPVMLDGLPLPINKIQFNAPTSNIPASTNFVPNSQVNNTVIITESYKSATSRPTFVETKIQNSVKVPTVPKIEGNLFDFQIGVPDKTSDTTILPAVGSSTLISKTNVIAKTVAKNGDATFDLQTKSIDEATVLSQASLVEKLLNKKTSASNNARAPDTKPYGSGTNTDNPHNVHSPTTSYKENTGNIAPESVPNYDSQKSVNRTPQESVFSNLHQDSNSTVFTDLNSTSQNINFNTKKAPQKSIGSDRMQSEVKLKNHSSTNITSAIPRQALNISTNTARTRTQMETTNSHVNNNLNKHIPTDTVQTFDCINGVRGRYSDKYDCRKFYICIGNNVPIVGYCPETTVFSDLKKLCTKNMSHCIRENQFKCPSVGRFSDFMIDNLYYICINHKTKLYRFKFQCQKGYILDKTTVHCIETKEIESNESVSISSSDNSSQTSSSVSSSKSISTSSKSNNNSKPDNSSSNNDNTSKSKKSNEAGGTSEKSEANDDDDDDDDEEVFKCKREGKFSIRNECRRYYLCKKNRKSEYRRKIKKCNSGKVFHKDKKKCVDDDSYEC